MRRFRFGFLFVSLLDMTLVAAQESDYVNSIGIEFVLIQPGSLIVGRFQPPYPVPADTVKSANRPFNMWMGDGRAYNAGEFEAAREMAIRDSKQGFRVSIDKGFYLSKYEVTQEQWSKVMGDNPSVFKQSGQHPVESITWEDTQAFIEKLNSLETGKRYRLPTEFEWEYAARAGREGDIGWSDTQLEAHLGTTSTVNVGSKKANPWGLYDMLGNVWEWVEDIYNEKLFPDPDPPEKGTVHVLKGASFTGDVKNATWLTHAAGPGNGWDVGFRIVLEIEAE